jgi:hypothetical protein
MNTSTLTVLGALCLASFVGSSSAAVVVASDNATNYGSGWSNGSNGGTGFTAWNLSSGNGGWFRGAASAQGPNSGAIDTSGNSFGMWADGYVTAQRGFASALGVGDVFSFDMAYKWDNGNRGFTLSNAGSEVFNFNVNSSGYSWSGGGSAGSTPWVGARENGVAIDVAITRTSSGFSFTMTSAQGLSASGSVAVAGFDSFKFYVSGAGGEGGNLYANSFLVTAVPAPGAIALLGVAGLVGARRRR